MDDGWNWNRWRGLATRLPVPPRERRIRIAVGILAIVAVYMAVGAIGYQPPTVTASPPADAGNVTIVSVQGDTDGDTGGIYVIDTETKAIVAAHTSYYDQYFDVDPIDDETVLFTVRTRKNVSGEPFHYQAVLWNWRRDTVEDSFAVPPGTHDVDHLGGQRYIVASKLGAGGHGEERWLDLVMSRGWLEERPAGMNHSIYILDRESGRITWQYRFQAHYPDTAGDGIENDYTHLNDVDVVHNGSAILASPREFDRVILIDRETKETIWELGAEDDYETLYEQHNPVLLTRAPPTVLVADSRNGRVVEYTRRGDTWVQTWSYGKHALGWPRDADRLPNGNTMITDSETVSVVSPEGEIVWERDIGVNPYDIERLAYGDEPRGPPMHRIRGEIQHSEADDIQFEFFRHLGRTANAPPDTGPLVALSMLAQRYYRLSIWVLPAWIDPGRFVALHVAALALVGLITDGTMAIWRRRSL
jgi:hypothetical protein